MMMPHPTRAGLRVLMAVSADGYVAKGSDDDMSWTGLDDKQLFRSLTVSGGVLGMGRTTYDLCGEKLRTFGRRTVCLSSRPGHGIGLGAFAFSHPGAWLVGGLTVVREAVRLDLVDEVHLIENPNELGHGVPMDLPVYEAPWSLDGKLRLNWGCLVHRVFRRQGR